MKSRIVEELGQSEILLPALIAKGLAANDRVKVRLSVLQALVSHAQDPNGASFDLANECRTVAIDPIAMESVVNHATLSSNERIVASGLAALRTSISDDVRAMAEAVEAGDSRQGARHVSGLPRSKKPTGLIAATRSSSDRSRRSPACRRAVPTACTGL